MNEHKKQLLIGLLRERFKEVIAASKGDLLTMLELMFEQNKERADEVLAKYDHLSELVAGMDVTEMHTMAKMYAEASMEHFTDHGICAEGEMYREIGMFFVIKTMQRLREIRGPEKVN